MRRRQLVCSQQAWAEDWCNGSVPRDAAACELHMAVGVAGNDWQSVGTLCASWRASGWAGGFASVRRGALVQLAASRAGAKQGRGPAGHLAPASIVSAVVPGLAPALEECAWRRLAAVHPSLTQPGPAAGTARRRRAICLAPGSSAAPSQSPT